MARANRRRPFKIGAASYPASGAAIKQHLRVKKFYGTSPNAVKTQLWVASIVYLLVAILKKDLA
jgi:hypothetical protein